MKWSISCIVALLCLALSGQAYAQVTSDRFRKAGAAYLSGNVAPASPQTTADKAMPLEEIARRLIRKIYEPGRVTNPKRVTFTSVLVNSQGTDDYAVHAKYTVWTYSSDSTWAFDRDYQYVLSNQAGAWRLHHGSGTMADEPRMSAKATPPPPGETDVPAAGAAQPDRGGYAAPASPPAPAATQQPTQNRAAQAQPQPSAANGQLKQLKYKVGQRVDYIYNGKWYKAIIIGVRDDSADHLDGKLYSPYRVHPLGYETTMDTWVCCADDADHRTQLRPAGSGPTEPVPGGEANDPVLKAMSGATSATPTQTSSAGGAVPAKQYHCVLFVGDQLVDAAPFTITGNSTYTDSEGKRGTFLFNSASSILTFRGGNYDGQRAEFETKGGLPQLHILGPSGRRVIDCD